MPSCLAPGMASFVDITFNHPKGWNVATNQPGVQVVYKNAAIGGQITLQFADMNTVEIQKGTEAVFGDLSKAFIEGVRGANKAFRKAKIGLNQRRQIAGFYDGFTTSLHAINGANDTFLQRVDFTVTFADGRHETYTTFVTKL